MAYYKSKSIGERLNFSKGLINIVLEDPEVGERMSRYNYGEAALSVGLTLVDAAERMDLDQRDTLGRQTAATRVMEELLAEARTTFNSDRRIARTLLRTNEKLYKELRLGIRTATTKGQFLLQARHFYEQIITRPEVVTLLQDRYRISGEVFTERLEDLNKLEAAMQVQRLRIGENRVLSGKRIEAMKELDEWMAAFIGVARQAFRGEEAQLAKLGVAIIKSKPEQEEDGEGSSEGGGASEGAGAPEGAGSPESEPLSD